MTKRIDTHLNDYRGGRISRRTFMRGAVALGLTVATATRLASQVEAAQPKKGGHFRLGYHTGFTSDTLDPATFNNDHVSTFAGGTIRNTLTEVTHTFDVAPELAESWEALDGARKWIFNLRPDVTFHSGKPLTVEDVIASINHHRKEDSKSAAKGTLTPIQDISADGNRKVVFELNQPLADLPYFLADYHLMILPVKNGELDFASGDGTGPYIMDEWEPGVRGTATRNPDYFKPDRGHFDSVEILTISDTNARTNALVTGSIDVMNRCDPKTAGLLEQESDIDVFSVTGTQHYTLPMLTDTPPFDNNDVRLALKHAIDREVMLRTILKGYGKVANDHPIAPANRYFNDDLEQRVYDPDKAKHHLKKAGMSSLEINLSASDAAFTGAVDLATLYKEQAAAAGIMINVVREPADGYWANVWMNKPFVTCYWSGRPVEDQMFSMGYSADAPWNDTRWKNERFNELLVQGRAELDESKRREIYGEMQRIVRDKGGTVIPLYADFVSAASTKLAHGEVAGNFDMDGLRITERWWFA